MDYTGVGSGITINACRNNIEYFCLVNKIKWHDMIHIVCCRPCVTIETRIIIFQIYPDVKISNTNGRTIKEIIHISRRNYHAPFLGFLIIVSILLLQFQSLRGTSESPYNSGYDHGRYPGNRYIN